MSIENPKISVIMPCLNVRRYIVECVDSVIEQTLDDIEIIFVDAGSTDGTLEILKEYEAKDSRITLIHSDKKSYGHQMNLGISHAKGKYIGIVETDDYIAPEMYEQLYRLSNNGSYDIVKSSFIYVNEDTDEIYKDRNRYIQEIPNDRIFNLKDNAYLLTGHPSIWAGIYKKDFLLINDIKFMEVPGAGWVDNPFFHETACLAKTIRYTDEAYYYYRESNPDSSSNKLNDFTLPIRRMLDNLDVIDKYPECKTEDVLKVVYWRANIYLNNIENRVGFEENLPIVRPYIKEMVDRMDETVVRKHFNLEDQHRYFNYASPLPFLKDGDNIEIPSSIYWEIRREVDFLNLAITLYYENTRKLRKKNKKLRKENKKIKRENKKLRKENKKIKKLNKSLLNSSSWKITKPLRWLKRLFK